MPQQAQNGSLKRDLKKRLNAYLKTNIREDLLLEIQMLILSIATGIEDAATFADFHCFVSNQTGNTILFAVEAASIGSNVVSKSQIAVSLGMFIVGGWIMGQLGNLAGVRRRWWLLFSSLMQTILVFATAAIDVKEYPIAILSLLALSAGAQVSMSRSLQMTEITTANATSAYIEIFIDEDLYKKHNRPRNRRIAFLAALFGGSFIGAFIFKARGSTVTLVVSGGFRILAFITFFFNSEISTPESDDLETGEIEIVHQNEPKRPVPLVPLFVEALVAEWKS